jgi:hypothetical protein
LRQDKLKTDSVPLTGFVRRHSDFSIQSPEGDVSMWKIFVAFIAFALLALFVIMKGGDKIDMQGEAAGHNPTEAHGSASTPATPAAPAAPAAPSEAAPAASK